jgi:hypothetical protein
MMISLGIQFLDILVGIDPPAKGCVHYHNACEGFRQPLDQPLAVSVDHDLPAGGIDWLAR